MRIKVRPTGNYGQTKVGKVVTTSTKTNRIKSNGKGLRRY